MSRKNRSPYRVGKTEEQLGIPRTHQIPTPKGFLEQRIKDNPIMPCYGLFNEEYTMDSECPRCPIIEQCKQSTKNK